MLLISRSYIADLRKLALYSLKDLEEKIQYYNFCNSYYTQEPIFLGTEQALSNVSYNELKNIPLCK